MGIQKETTLLFLRGSGNCRRRRNCSLLGILLLGLSLLFVAWTFVTHCNRLLFHLGSRIILQKELFVIHVATQIVLKSLGFFVGIFTAFALNRELRFLA